VVVNDYYGALNMVNYLIKQAAARLPPYRGLKNLLLSNNRKAGYLEALTQAGIPADGNLIVEAILQLKAESNACISCLKRIPE
jgi:LacI family transcriptional regulator